MQGPYRRGHRIWIELSLVVVGAHDYYPCHGVCDDGLLLSGERRRNLDAMRRNVSLVHIECFDGDGGDDSDPSVLETADVSSRRFLTAHRRRHMFGLLSELLSRRPLHFVPI